MRKTHFALIITGLFLMNPAFADRDMTSDSKPCAAIAKACLDAGYSQESTSKTFWSDCMRPLLLNKSVTDVNLDASTVKMCRADKIAQLKRELEDLKKAFNGTPASNTTKTTAQ